MGHGPARVHDVRNVADPLRAHRHEQGLARLADHPGGVVAVQEHRADAVPAHRADAVRQQQPARRRFQRRAAVADLDDLPRVRGAHSPAVSQKRTLSEYMLYRFSPSIREHIT